MNLFTVFEAHVRGAVAALVADGVFAAVPDVGRVVVEPTRDASHGDIATNAAMVLQKEAGLKPRDLAERIAGKLRALPDIQAVAVAGPGFINLTVAPAFWTRVLASVLELGPDFGRSRLGGGEKINVEFVSANPTGPMHVGHCRGAVVGDALAGLLDFAGFDVTREYYINDGGGQVDTLGRSAFLRYREALGEVIAIPEGYYPGDYLKPVGEELARRHGAALADMPESRWLPIVREEAIEAMMALIRADLALLNVHHDVFSSERAMQAPVDRVGETIAFLEARGDVYQGRLPPPKGQKDEDWEDREQTLFRATAFGDDIDRPLMKSDGSYTYFASDIAYHKDKFNRGFASMIDVLGADHGGYVKRMQAAVRAVTGGKGELDVKLCQLVRLLRGGEPVKMSKRSGDFVTLREVVEEVGCDATRFIMLMRKNDATLDFDLAKVVEQSKDNPVFYVQYAHARCKSVFQKARETFGDLADSEYTSGAALDALSDEGEQGILKRIAQFPRLVEQAAHAHEPHRIAFYLYELASELHAQYNRGRDLPHLRFIRDDNRLLTGARLALVRGVETILKSGLSLLGVSAPNEMR
ncbi:arginine--tRNA ligase [Labrys monachus]|uniref:Arginine--tRNA ligase n=1 Tax=Labrys monachus TaxID=217067 RepID=A0ABU0FFV7_9HYPH|nr:arginine--tRNA ligase [Labrys monachus]MDQ0393014.1 arginyl-tRNA synthetase [Labrys monachus]